MPPYERVGNVDTGAPLLFRVVGPRGRQVLLDAPLGRP